MVSKTAGPAGVPPAAPLPPLIEKGFTLPAREIDEDEDVSMLGAVDGGITLPSPPRVLEYVSSKDMSPEPRWDEPYKFR